MHYYSDDCDCSECHNARELDACLDEWYIALLETFTPLTEEQSRILLIPY